MTPADVVCDCDQSLAVTGSLGLHEEGVLWSGRGGDGVRWTGTSCGGRGRRGWKGEGKRGWQDEERAVDFSGIRMRDFTNGTCSDC